MTDPATTAHDAAQPDQSPLAPFWARIGRLAEQMEADHRIADFHADELAAADVSGRDRHSIQH
jgi:hypothetical protein